MLSRLALSDNTPDNTFDHFLPVWTARRTTWHGWTNNPVSWASCLPLCTNSILYFPKLCLPDGVFWYADSIWAFSVFSIHLNSSVVGSLYHLQNKTLHDTNECALCLILHRNQQHFEQLLLDILRRAVDNLRALHLHVSFNSFNKGVGVSFAGIISIILHYYIALLQIKCQV